MKKIITIGLVLIVLVGGYLTYNLESIFADSSPVYVGIGISNEAVLKNINLLDIELDTRDDIENLFGQPHSYIWGDKKFSIEELGGNYIMIYSDDFHIWMVNDKVVELRFYGDFYTSDTGVSVNMKKVDVVDKLGEPSEIRVGKSNGYMDDVLYEDINGDMGYCYYSKKEKGIRLFFTDYKVNAMYIMSPNTDDIVKEANTSTTRSSQTRVNTDDIDLLFVNDEAVIGTWKSVDFVKNIDQFEVDSKFWGNDLYLDKLVFEPDGVCDVKFLTWTKGIVIHKGDQTASAYLIKDIGGASYMFYEWKSGDYIFRDMKPSYYVLKKEE